MRPAAACSGSTNIRRRRTGRPGGMTFVQNRGVAVSDGKVFFGTTDNYLVALDQKTGAERGR